MSPNYEQLHMKIQNFNLFQLLIVVSLCMYVLRRLAFIFKIYYTATAALYISFSFVCRMPGTV